MSNIIDIGQDSFLPETAEIGVVPASYSMMPAEVAAALSAQTTQNSPVSKRALTPSECACQGNATSSLAYALGQLGYDFGSEPGRDAISQMSGEVNLHDPLALLDYLQRSPSTALNLVWTLSLDATVVYAIQPYGPFAINAYDRLQQFLREQVVNGVERISIPGHIKGKARLLNGQEVPVLYPDLRGMYSWSTSDLITACVGAEPTGKKEAQLHASKVSGIHNFLDRIYYEVRNLGMTPQERAMNYAATNAFQVVEVYSKAIEHEMKLDSIEVERSPICRPGSDCWDVKLVFFNPAKRLEQARHVYRFTVDVSQVIPVTVGKTRHWDMF